MKFLFMICFVTILAGNAKADTITTDSLAKLIVQGNDRIEKGITRLGKDTTANAKSVAKSANNAVVTVEQIPFATNLIAFLPVIFFLVIIMVVASKLRRDNIKLSDFLIDKDLQATIKKEEVKEAVADASVKVAAANAVAANAASFQAAGVAPNVPLADTANTATSQGDEQQQSVSRLIAFISGISSIALAMCIATFYLYRWSIGDFNVNISNLTSVLYGLGLGVVPYGFNKFASALRS